jgi:hypothetical protein
LLAGASTANGVVLAELVARRVGGRTATLAALVVAILVAVGAVGLGTQRAPVIAAAAGNGVPPVEMEINYPERGAGGLDGEEGVSG